MPSLRGFNTRARGDVQEMKDILKLIENVDPEDSAALDEIDYRVFKFIHGRAVPNRARRYTTSRDALKSIRPEGYTIWCLEGPNPLLTKEKSAAGWHCSLLKAVSYTHLTLPTNREV